MYYIFAFIFKKIVLQKKEIETTSNNILLLMNGLMIMKSIN